jgi:hypothetical protein
LNPWLRQFRCAGRIKRDKPCPIKSRQTIVSAHPKITIRCLGRLFSVPQPSTRYSGGAATAGEINPDSKHTTVTAIPQRRSARGKIRRRCMEKKHIVTLKKRHCKAESFQACIQGSGKTELTCRHLCPLQNSLTAVSGRRARSSAVRAGDS